MIWRSAAAPELSNSSITFTGFNLYTWLIIGNTVSYATFVLHLGRLVTSGWMGHPFQPLVIKICFSRDVHTE